MTVYKPKGRKTYEYDFRFLGERHRDNTYQTKKEDALAVEAKVKERLRLQAGGIYVPDRDDSPRFQDWAEIFLAYKEKKLSRPEALADILPIAMRFWGAPSGVTASADAPCHDLRLIDPINDPQWILKYEAFLERRGLGAQSKNHYRGVIRRMYHLALLPEYRQATGIVFNPFAGVPNDPTFERTVSLEPKQLRAWIAAASYHVRLAVAIASLAPKLRLQNVLGLRWAEHFDPDPRTTRFNRARAHYIVLRQHKTARQTRRPMEQPVSAALLHILKDAWRRHPEQAAVITYQGRQVHDITAGVKAAVEAAGLPYGRDREDGKGITFHTIRHTAATLMSNDIEDPLKLMDAMGHGDLRTTMKYRHRKPKRQKPAMERLSRTLQLVNAVVRPPERARRKA